MTQKQIEKWQQNICDLLVEELIKANENAKNDDRTRLLWQRPWRPIIQKSLISNHEYQGVNQLLLAMVCHLKGYPDNRWLTYNQLASHNRDNGMESKWHIPQDKIAMGDGHLFAIRYPKIRYRQKNCSRYYTSSQKERLISQSQGRLQEDDFEPLKSWGYHHVYNASIVEGIEPLLPEPKNHSSDDYGKSVARFLELEGLEVVHAAQNQAFYDVTNDRIVMPLRDSFFNETSYRSTLLHEIVHATGATFRLARLEKLGVFGSEAYAMEELVAELGSVLLASRLNIEMANENEFDNNLAYLDGWIRMLQKSPNVLFEALEHAAGACDYFVRHSDLVQD